MVLEAQNKPINPARLLLESRTSTDGSVSPKPRWCRGIPPKEGTTIDEETSIDSIPIITPMTSEMSCSSSSSSSGRPSPEQFANNKCDGRPYVAWAWLLEDQQGGLGEDCLKKPVGDVVLPQLLDAEKGVLCRTVEQHLLEVSLLVSIDMCVWRLF